MRRKALLLLLAFVALTSFAAKTVSVTGLKVEGMQNPSGIDTDKPRFSWIISAKKGTKNVKQTAYQIVASSTAEKLAQGNYDLWDSKRVESNQQLWIAYEGVRLKSGQEVFWRVKVETNHGTTEWSKTGHFSIGILNESGWSGYWIGLEQILPDEQRGMHTRLAARYLRKEFDLSNKAIKRATAYVAGLGLYEFFVNGQQVCRSPIGMDGSSPAEQEGVRSVLSPVPSDYRKVIYYNTFDITSLLANSSTAPKVCLAIALGNGRLFPMQQHKPYKIPYFGLPKCRINVAVEYSDGTKQRLQTDDKGWRVTADGPIRANNEYDGEEYDARQEIPGWNEVGFQGDSLWLPAQRTDIPTGTLRPQMTEGMAVIKKLPAKTFRGGIVDLGQNIAGWLRIRVRGNAGDTIRIVYAEKLNPDGSLYRENFRNAISTDTYVCNGREEAEGRWWTPTFVYHGFRYAEIRGLKNAKTSDFIGEVVADEMHAIGHFECSDTTLNHIMRNAWWGIMDNYKGMPVDCPQRDERQPWLGDRTAGSLGESYLFNNERLYAKWMRDICLAQRSDGCIPDVAPSFWNYFSDNVTWPAALPFSCDMLLRQFGNRQPIEESYPYIKRWLNHILEEFTKDNIVTRDRYGDWCVPPEKLELIHSKDPSRVTDGALISTAYVIAVMKLLEQWNMEPEIWNPLRERMTEAFNQRFLTIHHGTSPRPGHVLYPDSIFYGNNTVTANILPLCFGIVPDEYREEVAKQVVENICVKSKGHVSCGVIGISWLLRTLSDCGYSDVAYLLATQKTYPSWGYMAEQGATTIWELWNGDKANPAMNSGNHVMLLGDLVTWCYQYLGGIRSHQNGKIVLKPSFDIQNCEWVSTSYETPYGLVVSKWKKTLQHLDWHIEVPCNTTAEVYFPDGTVKNVGSGEYEFHADIPTRHPAIAEDEFLYEHAYFPEAHASTIVKRRNGELVAAYFGGTKERNPDVGIWVSIRGKKGWSAPILAADGVLSLNDKNAALMGVSGINDSTTNASQGPIRHETLLAAGITPTPANITSEESYDYITHTSRLTDLPESLKRKACWNPVLFEMPDGELRLFFKIGTNVGDWTGWLCKSRDGGRTWSDKEPLPEGFLGPVKNKPEIVGNNLVCGSSTEPGGWKFHVELMNLSTGEWTYVGPIAAELAPRTEDSTDIKPIDCIQPSILKLGDGRLQVLMRTRNGRLATSQSCDNGYTWSPVTLTSLPNNQSGTDAVTLSDGRHALIYNNFATIPGTKKGPRTPLSIALSEDGQSWEHAITLEDSPIDQYSYPAIIQGRDGSLLCVYTWRRQRVAFKKIDLKQLK